MSPDLKNVFEDLRAYKRSRILAVAIELGLLDALRNGDASVEQVAVASGVTPDWAWSLLVALAGLGLVSRRDGCWRLTASGIAAHDDQTVRAFAEYHVHCYEAWLDLPRRCRSEKGSPGFHRQRIVVPEFAEAYVRAMEAMASPSLAFLLKECCLSGSILDIGAGPSTFCRHLANTGTCRTTGVDFPPIVEAAKKLFHYPKNYIWVASDIQEYAAPESFNAVFCSHILEYCPAGELQRWLEKFRRFLRPNGKAAFVVFLVEPAQNRSVALDLFELSTGVNGDRLGHICTKEEFQLRLTQAGATGIQCCALPAGASYSEYLVTCGWS